MGIPDPVYGEEIQAFVVIKSGKRLTEEELIAFCKEHLPTFKSPKKVQSMESLPNNILGKVLRAELRKLDQAQVARQAAGSTSTGCSGITIRP